ncbi:ABC-type transport system ATP-binding protein (probable substrate spermidine/putrescine) (plasmid) [Natrialba magadii ATCC 43099]|uniref:Molybdate/tungstate import ATP-binding protein WtpC n=1 Tax=Natrialba magadii (strain ATCC 43099 / DSM 3394 / CCM 3739 / CIP 104546 / IAM 13178 / JCM 8861 / NBRC 102185 / NCIMB 2190 / MS3) TaxID=547559 RepID=D3T1E4_NATMM|nr:ABC transporter ATP-binding protein [Natrialba magadii]ADD07403.1 ABC-type transport system ATP-binding protein (probable substrate spermidine/putrescine) [Natrialba magadii ATCC 43099]ELY32427.1 spermidine/putrescine ABC transporter ATPase [Natrialba magadii ATCC 43099]
MSDITIHDLRKEFGSVLAVDDVDFDITEGEFISILGPSGSGKSTILRMIAGFESPTAGEIRIGGDDVVGEPPFDRDVNMMFQDLALFPHLTVAENIAYGLKQGGVPADEREDRVQEMLEIVHLEGYGDREPHELSGGEQQRVALARALINEPKLLLFDEPLASLDRKLRQHMQIELQQIQHETGITFLYVTHDQEVAMAVSDRLIVLNNGQIEQIGTAEQLYDEPNNSFVANFIGDINTLPAELERDNGNITVDIDDATRAVDGSYVDPGVRDNGHHEIDFCIRPDDMRIEPSTAAEANAIAGTVRNRIYKGGTTTYHIDTNVGTVTAELGSSQFDVGDEVGVSWSDDAAYLFPRRESEA